MRGDKAWSWSLHFERNCNRHRRLQAFETGSEAVMTGGWLRELPRPRQLAREQAGMEQAARQSLVKQVRQPSGGAAG